MTPLSIKYFAQYPVPAPISMTPAPWYFLIVSAASWLGTANAQIYAALSRILSQKARNVSVTRGSFPLIVPSYLPGVSCSSYFISDVKSIFWHSFLRDAK